MSVPTQLKRDRIIIQILEADGGAILEVLGSKPKQFNSLEEAEAKVDAIAAALKQSLAAFY